MATISEALALAFAHYQAGRFAAAELICQQIVQAEPRHAAALHLWGVVEHQCARHEAAAAHILQAIEADGLNAAYHANLSMVYRALRRHEEAAASCRRALQLKPDYALAHFQLGNALQALGQTAAAAVAFRQAVQHEPENPVGHNNLGCALCLDGQYADAIQSFRRALQLKPDYTQAYINLGNAQADVGRYSEAVECYRRALELEPLHAGAYGNLATALQEQGLVAEALAAYRRSLELEPRDALIHSNSLMAMQYQTGITSAALAAAHAQYDARHAVGLQAEWKPHRRPTDRERRLRLGLVSPDFYTHPVGFFLVGIVENLDPREVEVFCYSDRTRGDGMTSRFEAAACGWRNVAALSDAELAEQIRADDIDILFDMAGHTAHNRLLVFARKPAPIQITWIGYQGTTGLQAMDYVLADRYMIPPGTETNFAEKVLRLPESYVCYEPPQQAPAVSPLPAESNGFVTFASFNNLAKINAEVVALWSQILRRLPASRLILKYQGLGDASVGRRYLELFAAAGVPAQQIVLQPRSPFAAYMATYAEVDIGLDPFPFSGSATTCESLWMGVPVVTWPGETFASRHGLSHLSNIGLTETIVHSAEEYVELAVALAHDLPWLAALRAVLRTRMAASPLCDAKRGAQGLTDVLRKVWREWNQKE